MKKLYFITRQLQRAQKLSARQASRRQLLLLEDDALSDIGITRAEAMKEGSKPFWK